MLNQNISLSPLKISQLVKNAVFHCKFICTDSVLFVAFVPEIINIFTPNSLSFAWLLFSQFLLQTFIDGALILRINSLLNNSPLKWRGIFICVSKRCLSYFTLLILCTMMIIIAGIMFIIPAIIVWVFLSMSSQIFWLEKKSVIHAIRASYNLVLNNWSRTACILLISLLPAFLLALVSPQLFLANHQFLLPHFLISIITSLLTLFANTLFIEFYYDLKNRKFVS